MKRWQLGAAVVGLLLAVGCTREPEAPVKPRIVVTSSLLECAVAEVAGDTVRVVRLTPPGACPGHFDATPADIEQIARSSAFLRHDYQAHLDRRLTEAGRKPMRAHALATAGAQTIPGNYIVLCRDVCAILCECFPPEAAGFRRRLDATVKAVQEMEQTALAEVKPKLAGKAVVASLLQKDFCEWAGVRVAATFDSADQASLRGVEETMQAARGSGAAAVVCNLQRGTREGDVLGERLALPVVVLTNFPERPGDAAGGYGEMLKRNMQTLTETLCHD